jgi:hypothetical protein
MNKIHPLVLNHGVIEVQKAYNKIILQSTYIIYLLP